MPVLESHNAEIGALLTDLAEVFQSIVPPGTRVWTSMRDRRSDDCYHTFARAKQLTQHRDLSTKGLHKDKSLIVKALKQSFDHRKKCVIITGSTEKYVKAKLWEPQKKMMPLAKIAQF